MDVIETAIRNAFEKGNAEDAAFRERVYRSAFAALDRALKANPGMTVEAAITRRRNLQAKIAEIESEFMPAAPAVEAAMEAAPSLDPGPTAGPAPSIDPIMDGPIAVERVLAPTVAVESATDPVRGGPRVEPDLGAALGAIPSRDPAFADDRISPANERSFGDDAVSSERDAAVLAERRRPLGLIFVIATLLALVCVGAWWAYQTGLFRSPAEIDSSVPNPPPTIEDEDFDPDEEPIGEPAKPGEADAQRNWITVFSPADPSLASAPGNTSAEVMQDDTGQFLRIRSSGSDSAIVFDVGQGILEQLAGKRAVFDVIARAEEGKATQISVNCNFGELGDCGRKRYAVGYEKGEFLFEIELPAKQPGANGTIAINSDIDGGGKAVDIYEIRVSPAQ